jgi:hypothetical protein
VVANFSQTAAGEEEGLSIEQFERVGPDAIPVAADMESHSVKICVLGADDVAFRSEVFDRGTGRTIDRLLCRLGQHRRHREERQENEK